MRIAILSRNKSLYSTNRLVRTAKKAGHRVNVIDPLKCNLLLGRDRHKVFYNSSTVDKFNIAITRIGASITDYGLAVVNQFDMMSIPVINDAASIARSRDKFRCLQLLNKHNIKLPRTIMVRSPENLATAAGFRSLCDACCPPRQARPAGPGRCPAEPRPERANQTRSPAPDRTARRFDRARRPEDRSC